MVYFLLVISILAFSLLLENKAFPNGKKIYCTIITIELILVSGLRDTSVGADTANYERLFSAQRSLGALIRNPFQYENRDPGYIVFLNIVRLFTTEYRVFLLITAIFFAVALGIFIYRNSKMPTISYLLYVGLFFAFFSITGHRQVIATGLCLLSYEFVKKRKLTWFILLMGIATTIHFSALIFIPFYFISDYKLSAIRLLVTAIATAVIFVFRYAFFELITISTVIYVSYTGHSGAGAYTFTLMLILVTIAAFWRMTVVLEQCKQARHYYNALSLAWITLPLVFVNPNAMRAVQYFSIFLMLGSSTE